MEIVFPIRLRLHPGLTSNIEEAASKKFGTTAGETGVKLHIFGRCVGLAGSHQIAVMAQRSGFGDHSGEQLGMNHLGQYF